MFQRKKLTREQAIPKIKYYCAYQERCQAEVREKLYSFGLWKTDVENIVSEMISENYLNEERFARLFAGGKFRTNQWGRLKIKYELKQKKISEYCIREALKEIDETKYKKTIEKLASAKWALLEKEKNIQQKKIKVKGYLSQKGYENEIINWAIGSIGNK